MKIISVAHQKGGVGKTTIALNLASCYSQSLKVGVMDMDLQGSLTSIKNELTNLTFISYDTPFNKLSTYDFDVVVVDTPPYLTNQLPELFAVSDFVLIPAKAGFFDVLAVKATIELLKRTKVVYPHLKYGVVLNMVKPRTGLTRSVQDILSDYESNLLNSTLSDRVSYTRSAIMSGVFAGDDDKAKYEVTSLADEIFTKLGL